MKASLISQWEITESKVPQVSTFKDLMKSISLHIKGRPQFLHGQRLHRGKHQKMKQELNSKKGNS